MRTLRFQRRDAAAQILQKTPESLQNQAPGIARWTVIVRPAHSHAGSFDMTSLAPPLSDVPPASQNLLPVKLALGLGLTALADWLFYDQRIGISLVLFAIALVAGSLLANRHAFAPRRTSAAAIVLLLALIPAIEELNSFSVVFVVAGVVVSTALLTHPDLSRLTNGLRAFRDLFLTGPFRLIGDVTRMTNTKALSTGLTHWLVPLVFGVIFIWLFASANPLIASWIRMLDVREASARINVARSLFWALVLSMVWPFLHVRWRLRNARSPAVADSSEPAADISILFGTEAILRSLILFNALFAVQTVLDLVYLWGNAKLPDGISYAGYAHRGAYPLIVTALLAAAFVLAAMRPGGAAEKSRTIRPLVYIWIGQNVMLVISSMLRLYRYVEIYLLTGWRIAALVWMLLVAIGLVLIVARIVREQSNGWLIRMNLIVLTAAFYGCALVNFNAIIADYNVSHSKQAGGKGVNLDAGYLYELGPQAIPAMDRAFVLPGICVALSDRNRLLAVQAADMASWRSWGFRSWRLQRYLDAREKPQAKPAS
jgi:uncharacterized protein DUF4153